MHTRKTPLALLALTLIAVFTWFGIAPAAPMTPQVAPLNFDMYVACWHDVSSEYHCGGGGDSSITTMYYDMAYREQRPARVRFASNTNAVVEPVAASRTFPSDSVNSVVITVHMRDGTVRTKTFPRVVDAIFLSRASTENMLYRYYTGVSRESTDSATRTLFASRGRRLMARLDTVWGRRAAPK